MTIKQTDRPFQVEIWHRVAFDAITGGNEEFGLLACRINGEASACICAGRMTPRGMEFMPLFVALTPSLDVEFPRGGEGAEEGGGGPQRDQRSAARDFAASKASVTHG